MATQVRIRCRGRVRMLIVAGAFAAFSLISAGGASAQTDPYSGEKPEVLPTRLENTEPKVVDGAGDAAAGLEVSERQPSSGTLPFTGADVTLGLVTGLAAIGTGSIIIRRSQS